MNTENLHLQFKKGENQIFIDGNKVNTNLVIRHELIENEVLIDIPALQISTSTFQNDIDTKVADALISFFNYRFRKEGIQKFIYTMLELGFDVKQNENADKKRYPTFRGKVKSVSTNQFEMA